MYALLLQDAHEYHEQAHGRSVDLLDYAARFAAEAHDGQTRKYTGEPYIIHPLAVGRMVGNMFPDVEMVAAAYLHDTVEDTVVTLADVYEAFGGRVGRLVDGLTHVEAPGRNRKARKALDRAKLMAADPEVRAMKVADMVDNSKTIVEHDPGFARVFMGEMREMLSAFSDSEFPGYADALFNEAVNVVDTFFRRHL